MLARRGFVILACLALLGACARESRPGAVAWGTVRATVHTPGESYDVLSLVAEGTGGPDAEMEEQLIFSLGRRGIAVRRDAPHRLRYLAHTVQTDSADKGVGVSVIGSGGSSGNNDLGLGLDLGIFSGGSKVRHTAFLIEFRVERADGVPIWHGLAEGRARTDDPAQLYRPVVPALLQWLGSDARDRPFTR